ncbi:MAG TPA: hypothetical protein VGM67_12070 [Gemmatimonadaceae bacterium]|jgi:hypothetical protein
MNTVSLLSPARCDGRRAQILLSHDTAFPIAQQLRTRAGASVGDVFSFLSGLYAATHRVVLLGSIATGKYADTLLEIFGDRLMFPTDFVGRGDMSRGGLLLRRVREARQIGA